MSVFDKKKSVQISECSSVNLKKGCVTATKLYFLNFVHLDLILAFIEESFGIAELKQST